ncbi:uncharacterized protein [Primulina huaijiensis]|uniref:uncharacterized protein n=1 Tax=Primulina huaijiensis TaxID=1492673 RepID=UPI003CC6FBE9
MEPLGEIQLPEERSEAVGGKRLAVDDGDVLTEEGSSHKRVKEGGLVVVGDVKKVADMVLVLAAMGKMRGGKGPTEAEKDLMAEARDTLVKICQGFAPKDVFPRDAFGGLIDDLGLNKLKEQRLGFRPPKISISEKLLISKRKMEKAEDFSLPSTPHSSQNLQGNFGQSVESRSAFHPARTSHLDKSSHVTMLSGIQSTSPLTYGTATTSTSLPYQLPTSEIKPMGSSALPSSHLCSTALPSVDRSHPRSNGSSHASHASQVPANLSSNATMRTPAWPVQPQSVSSAKIGDNKGPVNMSLKVEGAADIKSGAVPQTRVMTVAQTTAGPLSRGTNNVHAPHLGNTHAETIKIVQKILQLQGSERPTWIPPSRDYMNRALTCQVCLSTITEVDSVLICDGCEKGYHLKCLQATNQKGVPRGEWHCGKCLSLSNGKALPPKYGRVMRNATPPKVLSNSAAGPFNLSQTIGASGAVKASPPNVAFNGSISMQNVFTEVEVNSYDYQISGTKREVSIGTQKNDVSSTLCGTDNKISSGNDTNNVMKTSTSGSVLSANSAAEKTCGEKFVEINPYPPSKCEIVPHSSDNFQVTVNPQDGNKDQPNDEAKPLKKSLQNNLTVTGSNQLNELEVLGNNSANISGDTWVINKDRSRLHAVSWVGDPLQILDEKIYYSSCCINGHVYKAMDHVLIRFGNEKLVPSRLQSIWEDNNTTTKWVTVNRCYFPGDLPAAVGRPCGLESCEVYESSCGRVLMAGLIDSPCQVLPPRKFTEESERRTVSGTQHCLPPLYLCKWIYDEAKGLFRDISC